MKEHTMTDNAAIWNLHLIYRLSQLPARFDEAVYGKVRALEGVTGVHGTPSPDTATHLAFSTRFSNAVVAAVAAKQCLHKTLDEHNAKEWWWQRKVRLMDAPRVQQVA
jgi:hypothetical protein